MSVEAEIQEMVDRETRAWDAKDANALADLFHPDMVWPWPPNVHTHDPEHWVMILGVLKYDRAEAGSGTQSQETR